MPDLIAVFALVLLMTLSRSGALDLFAVFSLVMLLTGKLDGHRLGQSAHHPDTAQGIQ